MVLIPRKKFADKPALVVELKWDHSAEGAVDQIRRKRYTDTLKVSLCAAIQTLAEDQFYDDRDGRKAQQ